MKIKSLLPALIALLFIHTVQAHTFEITNIVFDRFVFYPNDVGRAFITINNSGNYDEFVYFRYSHSGQIFEVGLFYLPKHTTSQFTIFFIAPTKMGMHNVSFEAYNIYNKSLRYEVVTVNSKNYAFETRPSSRNLSVARGFSARLFLTIYNLGNMEDDYVVKVEGWEKYRVEENLLYLPPSQEKTLWIEFLTDSASAGEYKIKLIICSLRSFTCKENVVNFQVVKPEYEQTLMEISPQELDLLPLQNSSLNFTVKNVGFGKRNYNIEIESELNYTISETSFSLSPQEEKVISINLVQVPEGSHILNYTLYVDDIPIRSGSIKVNAFSPTFAPFAILIGAYSFWLGLAAIILILGLVIYFLRKRSIVEEI
ncbi:MAG: hypothetical protein QW507_00280 [Candidatus Nanoarchaeia archaeon]|nr:hypothetical protein [Candidatus Haiyanarchaeum thermophilum]MCW1302983.1 hypothetical protein [Candidatus Haiyanarchaeum thermophilum]MCW1303660.1 hypothetical protein [Candidatus Haiyanarchaeum thermophilum]MCW1306341.1 hypothetical protein [Candidatus Haiyanarchaeum thermophilum]MCW1307149.1 hypothetical protein [Candidatus Haiyanarchaeum thermophilum]